MKNYSTVDENSDVFLGENFLDFVNDNFPEIAWAFIGFGEYDFHDISVFIGIEQFFKWSIESVIFSFEFNTMVFGNLVPQVVEVSAKNRCSEQGVKNWIFVID